MMDIAAIDTSGATLPSRYHAAKAALRDCTAVDECKEWADKASALASYAKQAGDDQLEHMAKRIRARALRRAGELLKQIEPAKGGDRKSEEYQRDATDPLISRKSAASDAGLSERQAKTSLRLANVPEEAFEEMVEDGATVTQIADAGTKRTEASRSEAVRLVAALKRNLEALLTVDIDAATAGMGGAQQAEVRMVVARLDGIHDRIVTGF